jgi:hypothetical protein
MPETVLKTITALFTNGEPPRAPVHFSWRLVHRKKRPFLLLPETASGPSTSLELYLAQRPLGKLWRSVILLLLRTPAARFFRRVSIQADAASEWMQFLARQSGQPAGQLRTPAIKLGIVSETNSRLVLLLYDAGGYPIRVVKVGLNPQGRAAMEREADLLSHLPADVIGCTGITGRFSNATTSAFATAFFPGKSLATDVGIEELFHAWLNATPPEPIENLANWRELESVANSAGLPQWPMIRDALAGQRVRSTLFHGDFTPWNVRMTNLENIRAYDWESGDLRGIPAWDWFHFVVQTSILVKHHSPQRAAAELEQLVVSPRFQKYASDAGISRLIEPLLLAYLLHRKHVFRPLEGGRATSRLLDLLWTHWKKQQATGQTEFLRLTATKPTASEQIKSVFSNLSNLFWEPSVSPEIQPLFAPQLVKHWKAMVASLLWIGGVFTLSFLTNPHLIFTPFNLLPCVYLALKADRRLASIIAYMVAIAGPLLLYHFTPGSMDFKVLCWNILMRIIIFKLIVMLLDSVRKQSVHELPKSFSSEPNAIQAISGNWAVIIAASFFLILVVVLDVFTSPDLLLLPFYLLPCIILTLAMNWRWGTVTAVLAAILGPLLEHLDPGYQPLEVEFWNAIARFMIFEMVVLLLERIRRKNVLFYASPS